MSLSWKQKIIGIITILGLILIGIFKHGLYSHSPLSLTNQPAVNPSQNADPKVVSTTPELSQEVILPPNQDISINFNLPLQNSGELRYQITPDVEVNLKLSSDRKTITISPRTFYKLGSEYTIFIKGETKFDNKKTLNKEYIFHFKTIQYIGV